MIITCTAAAAQYKDHEQEGMAVGDTNIDGGLQEERTRLLKLRVLFRNHLSVIGVHEDGGVGVADAGGDGRGEHSVQEELLLGLHLELVRGARLRKLPHAGRHRGAHAEQRRGHGVHVA